MAKLKVLFLETHYFNHGQIRTHGVDFARVVNPARALMKHPDFEVEVRKDPTEGSPQKSWDEVTAYFDIIFSSYIDSPTGYVNLALWSKKNHKPFIVDIDDNLWEIPKESPTYAHYHPGSQWLHNVSVALEDTPYITTTNQFLKYRLIKYLKKQHDQIKVVPNFIDLERYDYTKLGPKKDPNSIVIGFFGTNTHIVDMFEPGFLEGLTRVIKENPNVYFETTGFFLPQLKTRFKRQYVFGNGEPDVFKWVDLWARLMGNTDIVVAPLVPTDFNRCKSGIKYLEYSAAKKPGVYQDIRQYQELVRDLPTGKTGFLAGTADSWYKNLSALVKDEQLRRQIGENAYNFIKEKHTIEGNINLYADYIKWVVDDYKKTGNLRSAGFILPERGVIQ